MLGHMTENPDAMTQMGNMMNSGMASQTRMNPDTMIGNMTGGMMGSGMMNSEIMTQMMQDPETRDKMIQIMSRHVEDMQELLSSKLTDDEFSTQIMKLMQDHMKEIQDLSNHQINYP